MFSGSYAHSVDNKGRLVIPARFRNRLGEKFVITRGLNGCLWVFPERAWSDFKGKLTPKSLLDSRALALERFFLGAAMECSPDAQGRVAIPQFLLEHAGIVDDIYIVGVTDRLEVWSKERWDGFNAGLTDEVIREMGKELGF